MNRLWTKWFKATKRKAVSVRRDIFAVFTQNDNIIAGMKKRKTQPTPSLYRKAFFSFGFTPYAYQITSKYRWVTTLSYFALLLVWFVVLDRGQYAGWRSFGFWVLCLIFVFSFEDYIFFKQAKRK
jgi:hypothetical protein